MEIMCVGLWVMEFLMTCWKSSTKAAMKAELFADPAGRGTSTEVASHTSEDCVTFLNKEEGTSGDNGPRLSSPLEFAKK